MKKYLSIGLCSLFALGGAIVLSACDEEPTPPAENVQVAVDGVVFTDTEVTYDKTEKTLVATGIPTGVDVAYATNALTNAGSVEATATLTAQDGYVLTLDGEEQDEAVVLQATLTVAPKTVTATIPDLFYTGEALAPAVTIAGVIGEDVLEYSVTYTPSEVLEIGDYEANITLDESNYVLESESVSFEVKEPVTLQSPNFSFRDGFIVVALIDENSDTWAYSYDGVSYQTTTQQSVQIEGIGMKTVYVKAVADKEGYYDSEPVSRTLYIEGTLMEYDFVTQEGEQVRDLSGNGAHLTVRGGSVTAEGMVIDNGTQTGAVAYTPQSLGYDNATSLTVEVVAKVDDLVVPAAGDKWHPLVYKTNEYFIGYWTVNTEPAKARLCMVLFSGNEGDRHYDGMWFDDTNFWLPLSAIEDGNYHSYAITYDEATGVVNYYMDYIQIGTATREAGDVCRYTGNSVLFGGWGNLYDVENNNIGIYSSVSYKYFKVRNYAVQRSGLTDLSAYTDHVIVADDEMQFAPTGNISNLVYLTEIDKRQYGSMTFEISFILNAEDMTNGVRYTVANRGESFQLYLIKDNGHIFGQCYVRTTEPSNVYGQTFLDFGAIDEYVTSFGDGTTVNTMKVTFDAITGRAKGQVNSVYINWCYKDFGGTLINPTYTHNQAFPLYIGSAAWGEALPASTQIKAFTLSSAPIDISEMQGFATSLRALVNQNASVDMTGKMLLIGASHFTLWYEQAAVQLAPDYDAINFGVGGSNAVFWDKYCDVLAGLQNDPEYILLTIAGNIVQEDAVNNITVMKSVMTKLAKMFPTSKIVFINPFHGPYWSAQQWHVDYCDEVAREMAEWTQNTVSENDYALDLIEFIYDAEATQGVHYKEGYGYLKAEYFLADGVHLNDAGKAAFAQIIKEKLPTLFEE